MYIYNFIWNKTELLRFKLLLKRKPVLEQVANLTFWRFWAQPRFKFFVRNHNIADFTIKIKKTSLETFTKCRKWIIDAFPYSINGSFHDKSAPWWTACHRFCRNFAYNLGYEKKSRNPKMSVLRPPRQEFWLRKFSGLEDGLYISNGSNFFVFEDSSKIFSVLNRL